MPCLARHAYRLQAAGLQLASCCLLFTQPALHQSAAAQLCVCSTFFNTQHSCGYESERVLLFAAAAHFLEQAAADGLLSKVQEAHRVPAVLMSEIR